MFKDRNDAGHKLADKLLKSAIIQAIAPSNLLVLSIPRGGVIVGLIVANRLGCEHDVVIVKKVGSPTNEEMAVGAMAEDGWTAIDQQTLNYYGITREALKASLLQTRHKVNHYRHLFRQGKVLNVVNKSVIIVDDGIATGETMKAAVHWVRSKQTPHAKIIIATPVCSPSSVIELRSFVDVLVCVSVPEDFIAVGQFYQEFEQVSDGEVIRILSNSAPN